MSWYTGTLAVNVTTRTPGNAKVESVLDISATFDGSAFASRDVNLTKKCILEFTFEAI